MNENERERTREKGQNHEGFFLIVSVHMQSENEIYGMWKIYNCKTFFSFLSAFSLMQYSALRHTWRFTSFNRAQLKSYLPFAHISNPTLLLLLLLMTLCRVFKIMYLKQTMFAGYQCCSCSVFTVCATCNVISPVHVFGTCNYYYY